MRYGIAHELWLLARGGLGRIGGRLARGLQGIGEGAFGLLVRGRSDAALERVFGLSVVQWAVFGAMARMFRPRRSFGFRGDLAFVFRYGVRSREPDSWVVSVRDGRARSRRGDAEHPAMRVKIRVGDFVRIAAGELSPMKPFGQGRIGIEGDPTVALRLGEMFGRRGPI